MSVVLVLHATSITTRSTCSTLLLMLFLSLNNLLANISGTNKLMHAIKNNISYQIPDIEPSDWLLLEVTLVMRGVTFDLVIFLWGLFPFPFPLTPKYLIPLECFPIPFPLPVCFALAQASYSAFIFFWKTSELIIRCFNLPCLTWSQAGGFSTNTIPPVKVCQISCLSF